MNHQHTPAGEQATPLPSIPPGVTLHELWHQQGGIWIERERPLSLADGDPPVHLLEPGQDEEAVARMVGEGCPHGD